MFSNSPHVAKETSDPHQVTHNTVELDPERIVESLLQGKPIKDFQKTTCDVWITVGKQASRFLPTKTPV